MSSARRVQTSAERSTATGEAALVRTSAVWSQPRRRGGTCANIRDAARNVLGRRHGAESAQSGLRATLGEELNKV